LNQRSGSSLVVRLASHWPDDAIEVRSIGNLAGSAAPMQHLVVTYDGSGSAAGVKLFWDGKPVQVQAVRDHLVGSFATGASLCIGCKSIGRPLQGQIDDLRIYDRAIRPSEIRNIAIELPVRALLSEMENS